MDIAVIWDEALGCGDIAFDQVGLRGETGLATAVLLSLFLDRRAEEGDQPRPDDPRGWWGDSLNLDPSERWGSRLWLLERGKAIEADRLRAEEYAKEALKWLVADGLVKSVEVEAKLGAKGRIGVLVILTKPDGKSENHAFEDFWKGR